MSAAERAVARVDLGAIERNCAHLRTLLTGGVELCAVVKAEGYGHGATWAAKAALAGGATWLAVATAAEAEDLRRHGIAERILVMGALTREEQRLAAEAQADVVAWTPGIEGGGGSTSSSTPGWDGSAPRTSTKPCGSPTTTRWSA